MRVDGLDAVITLLDGGAEERGKEAQILLDREVLIERELAWHVSYALPHLSHLFHHIKSIYLDHAAIGQQQRAKDAVERCLARSIRPYEPEHLALCYGERHIVECLHLAVTLAHMVDFDGVHGAG